MGVEIACPDGGPTGTGSGGEGEGNGNAHGSNNVAGGGSGDGEGNGSGNGGTGQSTVQSHQHGGQEDQLRPPREYCQGGWLTNATWCPCVVVVPHGAPV